jgi:hypothetical protein
LDYDSPPPPTISAPADEGAGSIKFPLFVPERSRCPSHHADEIVVCAENPETFRLRPLPEKYADAPVRPLFRTGENTSIGAELESAGVGGQISNRVMIRGRIKF